MGRYLLRSTGGDPPPVLSTAGITIIDALSDRFFLVEATQVALDSLDRSIWEVSLEGPFPPEDKEYFFGEAKELPKDKQFLAKYFVTDEQKAFLRHYVTFGEHKQFAQRSGVPVTQRWLHRNFKKLQLLEQLHAQAKEEMDFDRLALIESGKYKL